MILQSVRIESWKCFNRSAGFDFSPHLNIVHAPNGSGKSSLFEAIRCAFLEYSSTKNQSLKSVVPWGTSLGPFVEIYFMDNGQEYRLTKKFFQKSNSELYIKSGGSFVKKFESKSADEEVMRILNSNLNESPGSKDKWPLSKILLAPQGDLAIKGLSEDLKKNIRLSLSAQLTGASSFEDAIEKKYLKYFSEKDGKLRKGSKIPEELRQAETQLEAVRSKLEQANIAYNAFEQLSEKVAELRANFENSKNELEKHKKELGILQERQGEFQTLKNITEKKRLENSNEEKSFKQIDNTINLIENLSKKIARTEAEHLKIETGLPHKQKECENAHELFVGFENQFSQFNQVEKDLEDYRTLIGDARSFVQKRKLFDDLNARKTCADTINKDIDVALSLRSKIVAPDKLTLKKAKELATRIDICRTKIESALMRFEITPERDLSLDVTKADQPGLYELSINETFTVQGAPLIMASIPGVATFKLSGPSVSIEEDQKSLDEYKNQLDEILSPFPTGNIDELEALTDQAKETDDKIESLQKDLAREVGPHTPDELASEIGALQADLLETIAKIPEWQTVLPDPEEMEEEYSKRKKALEQDRSKLLSARDEAREHDLEAKKNLEQVQKDLKRLKLELEESLRELNEQNQDGKTQEERFTERSEISMRCIATKKELDDAEKRLKNFGEDPEVQIAALQSRVDELEKENDQNKEELQRTEGKLEDAARKVSYSEKISLEEKADEFQKRYDREVLTQNAIKLLRDTMVKCRENVFLGVSEPVERRATEIIKRIGDVRFSVVELKQDFEPLAIQPEVTSDPVSIQNISGGENEQLHLAVRIALAETLIRNDRHFMLLDDVLTATDSDRMDRILAILEELSDRFQIIILTCHPDRYQKLPSANFLDLLSA